ncbi:MAG: pyridoxamine 5'-phosphate oxidase [Phycisphaerae bacterium]|nr:pyridoxamine 5'-phosphate oxidase [Phycisphaerae bacterium]
MATFDQSDAAAVSQRLDAALPDDPLPLFRAWFDDAHTRNIQPNPNAMTLATADASGRPSARIVLCKAMDTTRGYLVFHTNRLGRKGIELGQNPHAAAVFHWDALDRQVRFEGPVTLAPDSESDAYFSTRPLISRVGAWTSEQSRPIGSREELENKARAVLARFGLRADEDWNVRGDARIPRPPHWGGYRLWARRVELWVGGSGRLHDRASWERELQPTTADGAPGFAGGAWRSTRLQP